MKPMQLYLLRLESIFSLNSVPISRGFLFCAKYRNRCVIRCVKFDQTVLLSRSSIDLGLCELEIGLLAVIAKTYLIET